MKKPLTAIVLVVSSVWILTPCVCHADHADLVEIERLAEADPEEALLEARKLLRERRADPDLDDGHPAVAMAAPSGWNLAHRTGALKSS